MPNPGAPSVQLRELRLGQGYADCPAMDSVQDDLQVFGAGMTWKHGRLLRLVIGVHYMAQLEIILDLTHSDEPLKGVNKKE